MHESEDQTGSRNHREENDSQEAPDSEKESPLESSLLDLVTAIVILIRQTWIDRWALVKAEARLAAKSLTLILLVCILLAMTLMLVWVLVLAVVSYWAWQAGAHWGWIAAGLFIAQCLMLVYLRGQLRRLLDWLSFPETRRAFAPFPGTDKPSPDAGREQ